MTDPVALFGQSHNGYKGDQRHRAGSLGLIAVTGLERRDLKVMGLASYQLLYTAMKIVSGD